MIFFKKIKLFWFFRKQILKAKPQLLVNFNARIDYIYRIYTVLNIPNELIEEPYNFRSSDINTISQNYIKAYSTEIQNYLNSIGLMELFDVYDVQKVDKYSYLLIYGYSLFDTKKVARNLINFSIVLLIILFIFSIIYIVVK